MKHLVLVGGGHAHLFVLQHLANTRPKNLAAVLITPSRWQDYSGMLCGWMAGDYSADESKIDLLPLAERAGVQLIVDTVVAMDAQRSCVCLPDGRHVEYDRLSLDLGSESKLDWLLELADKLLPIKPLREFRQHWSALLETSRTQPLRLAVVGGGAAGVEISFAAQKALCETNKDSRVTLIAGHRGLLADHAAAVRRRVLNRFAALEIEVINERAVGAAGALILGNGRIVETDKVIAATGASAPPWLKLSHLALDQNGFVQVDAQHRSLSHQAVFAAGDVCSRSDTQLPRSGVAAVKVGPVLAHNLVASLQGTKLNTFSPRPQPLYLLSCANRQAIASWGKCSAEGSWVWHWKDRIDRGFIRRFSA